jgi:small ligand-binding sensory domain FIST
VDPNRDAIAIADLPEVGSQLAFCTRDVEAARRDLVRICAEVREEAESCVAVAGNETLAAPRRIAGAIYVSCTGRGGAHFGAPSAELQIVRRALGDVPLVGFYAAGEIARHHLYGYTGVLTAFLD